MRITALDLGRWPKLPLFNGTEETAVGKQKVSSFLGFATIVLGLCTSPNFSYSSYMQTDPPADAEFRAWRF